MREEYRGWADHMADNFRTMGETSDLANPEAVLTWKVDQEWEVHCQRVEQAKAILRARAITANKTTAEAAEDHFTLLASVSGIAESTRVAPAANAEEPISIKKANHRGGRPRYPENEWAYHQVNDRRRKPDEVYREWLERTGDRYKQLDNPRDSFQKAIKPKKPK
jgi:hypothetical protein